MPSRPGTRVIVQVAGTLAAAVVVVGAFANLRTEPAAVPAGEQTQVRGIAAADLRGDVVTPTPTAPVEKTAAPADAKRETRKAPAPRKAQEAKTQEPARVEVVALAPAVDPGPPLPLTPAQKPEDQSFVAAAGKTSLAAVRTSTEFVTSTVPKAVVSTTRGAIDTARSFGAAVLDKVIP